MMRHYILSNCDEVIPWISKLLVKSYFILFTIYVFDKVYVHFYRSEHKEELGQRNPANVDKRHTELFVSWSERKVSHIFV